MENVKGLPSGDTKQDFYNMLTHLESIGYVNYWKVLNSKDYGIPQNRERVYIVGTKSCSFNWPVKLEMNDIKDYVDWSDIKKAKTSSIIQTYVEKLVDNTFIPLESGRTIGRCVATNYAGCITANTRMWCIPTHRYANTKELFLLQGFLLNFKQVVSNTQMKKQIGNSMSVNVVGEI